MVVGHHFDASLSPGKHKNPASLTLGSWIFMSKPDHAAATAPVRKVVISASRSIRPDEATFSFI